MNCRGLEMLLKFPPNVPLYKIEMSTAPCAPSNVSRSWLGHQIRPEMEMDMDMEMEMEMEMNIPLPEKLEWLESSVFPYDEEDEEHEPPLEEDPRNISDPPAIVTSPHNAENQISRKRSCTENIELEDEIVTEKRKKVQGSEKEPEIDDDWLRYSPGKISCENAVEEEVIVVEERILSRFASEIEGDCISVTGPSGDRVYAKLSHVEMDGTELSRMKGSRMERPATGLLAQPIDVLMERTEQEAFMKACQDSTESANDPIQQTIPVVTEQLWVDKYAPKSFTELLSDEKTNREVLRWFKQWDSRVFPSEKIRKETSDDVISALRRRSTPSLHQKFSNNKNSFKNQIGNSFREFQGSKQSDGMVKTDNDTKSLPDLWNKKTDAINQQEEKVLLLCGPPGLGKTTLAHVAAKHCGYRAVEINASDDRSSSTIESKILDVVQMNSVVDQEKPKCLIVDEIDGSLGEGKGAVEVILKMLAAEKKSTAGKGDVTQEAQAGKSSTKKQHKTARLSRPVICICNDLFAPALRSLRQVAKVHIFVQPTVSRVVNRLKYICNKEGFKASSLGLTVLADYTDCDIRSCLNTLQFLHKKKETLNILEVGSQVVGRKDISKGVYDVWKEVFQKRKEKGKRTSMSGCKSALNDFGHLHALISNCGDYELITDGIHENFLQLHYHDPMMQKSIKCLNILGTSDSFRQYIMRTQQMSLYVYQPLGAIAVQALIAQVEKPNIEWPKSFQRYRSTFTEKKDLLKSWHNNISPSISRHLSVESFVEDAISPLLHILSPPTLRPVALHLLSERERNDLNQLVDTMVSFSITYKNVKPEPQHSVQKHEVALDASALCFDPPITEFVKFKDYHSTHSGLPLAVRQILVHEVEKQKILRESIRRPLHSNDRTHNENHTLPIGEAAGAFSAITNSEACSTETNSQIFTAVSTQKQWKANAPTNSILGSEKSTGAVGSKLKTAAHAKKPYAGSSFFDRFRKSNSKDPQAPDSARQQPATLERDLRPLLFKFNEGFTNAVKRPVRIRELL